MLNARRAEPSASPRPRAARPRARCGSRAGAGLEERVAPFEAYTPTHGWRGFDPTNTLLASESHVKMAIGPDYGDVPPTRGTYRGPSLLSQ